MRRVLRADTPLARAARTTYFDLMIAHVFPLRRLGSRFALAALVAASAGGLTAPRAAEPFAPENGFGIGFVLGTPTGLTGSLPLGTLNAVNATVGWNLNGPANLFAQADYVWFSRDILPVESGSLSAYYGPGAFTEISRESTVGIRAVAGVEYRIAAAPVQTFLEMAPGITVLPSTKPSVQAGLGLRYFF